MKNSTFKGSNGKTISNNVVESQPTPVSKLGEIGNVGSASGGKGISSTKTKQKQQNNTSASASNVTPATTGGITPKVNSALLGANTQTTNPVAALGNSSIGNNTVTNLGSASAASNIGGATSNLGAAASAISNKNNLAPKGLSGPPYNPPIVATQDKKPLYDKNKGKSEGGSSQAKGSVGLAGQVSSSDATGVVVPPIKIDSSGESTGYPDAYGDSPVEYGYKQVLQGPGIVNERPTIILLADYKSLYYDKDTKTYVGEHFNKQLNSRLLRQNVINKIFSSQVDSTLPQDLRKNFDKGVSIAYDDVLLIFDIISKMKDLKDKLNFKSASYNVSGTNVIEQVLTSVGYSSQNLKLYSSTKLFYQLLIELKKSVIYSSYVPITNKKIPSNEDKIAKDISEDLFFPVEYGFNEEINNNISTIKDILSLDVAECYKVINSILTQQFIKNIDDPKDSFLISSEDFCAIAISIMCKDYKCRAVEKDKGFIEFLSKTYNYVPLDINFLTYVIENVIGFFGTSSFQVANNNISSLIALSNFTNNVRTFETDYYSYNEKLLTPGGIYYVDSLLNGDIQSFTTNLNSLSKQFKENSQNAKKVFTNFALTVNSSYLGTGFDPGDPLQIYHIILNEFYSKDENGGYLLKDSYKDDPMLILLTGGGTIKSMRPMLMQFFFYCAVGDNNKAKLVLDTIGYFIIQKITIKWGGSDDTDKGPDYASKAEGLDNEWWVNKKNEKFGGENVYWISGNEFYKKLYGLIPGNDVASGQASKLGNSVINLLKMLVFKNVTSSPKFMSDVSKFFIFCKIIFDIFKKTTLYSLLDVWTNSNISFGDKSVTTTKQVPVPEGPNKKSKVEQFYDDVNDLLTPDGNNPNVPDNQTQTVTTTTEGVVTGNVISLEDQSLLQAGEVQDFFSKIQISFQILLSPLTMQNTLENYIKSIESRIKKEIQIINNLQNTTFKILDTIAKSIDDLRVKINSSSFKILLKHVTNFDLIGQTSQANTSDNVGMTSNGIQFTWGSSTSAANQIAAGVGPAAANQIGVGIGPAAANQIGLNNTNTALNAAGIGIFDLTFLTKKQISLIANIVMDIKTKVTNDFKIKSGDYVHPIDDVLSDKNISDTFFEFFKNNPVGYRSKILSVGIPNGFSDQLYYKPSAKKNNSPKQNDVVSVDIYKIDVLNPDIIYKPQSFLFEMSRYVVTDPFYYKGGIEGSLKNEQNKIKFLNGFPTRNFDNLVADELQKIQYYDDVKSNSSYSFLTDKQKMDMYYNHVVSYLYEMYLKVLTGISLAEKDFYAKDTVKYLNNDIISTIKNTKISNLEADQYDMLGLAMEEISRNLTSISSASGVLHNIFIARKFERVFNIIFDPNFFYIDVEKTTKTQQGKDAFDFAVAQKEIIKDNSSGNYLPYKLGLSSVTMERFFVQVKTTNNEEVV